jgi:hypothetical protein
MSRLAGIGFVVLLGVVPSAQAAVGIRIDQKAAVVGASLHVTAFGPEHTAGMPVFLAPASIDFTPHPCGASTICGPTSDGPPSAPFVRLGRLPHSVDVFHTRRMSFRVPAVGPGAYRVVVYCESCVAGTAGSLITSPQTVRIGSGPG